MTPLFLFAQKAVFFAALAFVVVAVACGMTDSPSNAEANARMYAKNLGLVDAKVVCDTEPSHYRYGCTVSYLADSEGSSRKFIYIDCPGEKPNGGCRPNQTWLIP